MLFWNTTARCCFVAFQNQTVRKTLLVFLKGLTFIVEDLNIILKVSSEKKIIDIANFDK